MVAIDWGSVELVQKIADRYTPSPAQLSWPWSRPQTTTLFKGLLRRLGRWVQMGNELLILSPSPTDFLLVPEAKALISI
jgi:hypothetical protein